MLVSPEFILKDCLALRLDTASRREIARVVGCGEPNVRKWVREKKFPDQAFAKYMAHLETEGKSNAVDEINAALDDPYDENITAPKWRIFCRGVLDSNSQFFPKTLKDIYDFNGTILDAFKQIRTLETADRFSAYKDFLTNTLGQRLDIPDLLKTSIGHSSNWNELRDNSYWFAVEVFIYFMAQAEAECLWSDYLLRESKITEWALPQEKDGKVMLPLRVFFMKFFDGLTSKGYFSSIYDVAKNIEVVHRGSNTEEKRVTHISEESALREIKRAKYEGEPVSFETISAWIDALAPHEQYPSPDDFDTEKQLMIDLYAAARILDKMYREALKDLPEDQVLAHFHRYRHWYDFHAKSFVD